MQGECSTNDSLSTQIVPHPRRCSTRPPSNTKKAEYVGICVVTSLVTFFFWPFLSRVSLLSHMGTGMDGWLSQALDTIGLSSFAVAGTQHGIRRACHPGITIVICCITCSGGGILRDVSLAGGNN